MCGLVLMAACQKNNAVTDLSINPTNLTLKVGESSTLTAYVNPTDATDKTVTWSSSDASVATVDANGNVIGVKAGNATITATTKDGGKTATCAVTVYVPVTGVTLSDEAMVMAVGYSYTLFATVAPENATNKNVTWDSTEPSVASVDNNGKVTALTAGMTLITVTTEEGMKTAVCTVSVF